MAKALGIACFLTPIKQILREGNQAQVWLKQYDSGMSVQEIMAETIRIMDSQEQALQSELCLPASVG